MSKGLRRVRGAVGLGAKGLVPRWLGAVAIAGPVTLLSARSAAGSLALASRGEERELLGSGSGVADPES